MSKDAAKFQLIHARHSNGETLFEVHRELSLVPTASDTATSIWSLAFGFPARLGFVVDHFIIGEQDDTSFQLGT